MSRLNNNAVVPKEFGELRIHLDFTNTASELKAVGITSIYRGEGRTTTAMNLALAYAQSGQKTVFVDCDLRSLSVSTPERKKLETRGLGLSHFLSGQCHSKDIIGTSMEAHLNVINPGPAVSRPAELLASPRMKQLLEELQANYERVIIDCPPIGYIEAKVLASLCDGILLVLEYGKVSRITARKVQEEIADSRIKLLGTVINKSRVKKSKAYPYS
jgi:capsular exopolysaccharide synthesis family protein